jgi:hypothetical protein
MTSLAWFWCRSTRSLISSDTFSIAGICNSLNRREDKMIAPATQRNAPFGLQHVFRVVARISRSTRTLSASRKGSQEDTQDETLIYVARVEYSSSSACGALELCRMASSKRIYTASNLSGATQTAATAAMVGREALTRHYP